MVKGWMGAGFAVNRARLGSAMVATEAYLSDGGE
jgi:hypothetical protein